MCCPTNRCRIYHNQLAASNKCIYTGCYSFTSSIRKYVCLNIIETFNCQHDYGVGSRVVGITVVGAAVVGAAVVGAAVVGAAVVGAAVVGAAVVGAAVVGAAVVGIRVVGVTVGALDGVSVGSSEGV